MYAIGIFFGALTSVGVLTAIFNWLLRYHAAPIPRLILANGMSLFLATALSALATEEGGKGPDFTSAFATYVLPQLVWLIIGLARCNRSVENKVPEMTYPAERAEPVFTRVNPMDQELPLQLADAEPFEPVLRPSQAARRHHRFNNFIARNWRGEFSLWISCWVFGFLGNIVVGLISRLVAEIFSVKSGYEPRSIFALLLTTWFGVIVVATWQVVGVWRSADRSIEERRRFGKRAPWARLAKLAVIFGLLRLCVQFGNAGAPQIMEASRMAFLDDPSMPAYSIRIMRNGTEIEITGGFKYGLTDDFIRILSAAPQIRVVHLNSLGGRIGEAQKLNKIIREHGFLTYVSYQCASACAVAFAGGRERWLLDGAILGFHAPAFPGMSDADLVDAVKLQKDLFTAAGFEQGFINRALATPNKDMWRPSADELFQARAITAVSDGSNFAASGYGGNVTREEMAGKLTKVLAVLGTIKERLPTDYASIIDAFYNSYISGQTQTEIFAAAKSKLLSVIASYRPLADDYVLIELAKLLAEEYAALSAKDPRLCYLYASGTGGARNFSLDMPEPLIQRATALGERVIATASKRPVITAQMTTPLWKKISRQLAKRVGPENVKLVLTTKVDPSRYGDYCTTWIVLYQEIANLKQNEAGLLMRQILRGK
jgi:hypothetical protein